MSVLEQVKEDYSKFAEVYNKFPAQPAGILGSQLMRNAIGDASGLVVLDLGGGTGVHARDALDAGARRVDLVDITPEMLQVAEEIEQSLGHSGRIRVFEGDVASTLSYLPLEPTYDIVMANWVFDHADSPEMLERMWQNVEKYLKPGGKFVGVRAADLGPDLQTEKYGVTYYNFKSIRGGISYTFMLHGDCPRAFEATSMEVSLSGSTEMHEKHGLTDVRIVPLESAEIVQQQAEFWKTFLDKPPFVVVTAVKKG
ncbi:unnamed protein product [Clonostachys byssicola]|uniref:Methyltransferase domain-containing protein n=1 Tax=Clonostachys byssicola TaxID=160290 RepID=A0A9N9UW59_9HYPO|nr:unnamed protein product [Clonostachys byssicola]